MHYFSRKTLQGRSDHRAYAAALKGLDASLNIISITRKMRVDLLNGGHWSVMYSVFFAVYSLVYFLLENPTGDQTRKILEMAEEGRQILSSLRNYSLVAERCSVILKVRRVKRLKFPVVVLTDLGNFRSTSTLVAHSFP